MDSDSSKPASSKKKKASSGKTKMDSESQRRRPQQKRLTTEHLRLRAVTGVLRFSVASHVSSSHVSPQQPDQHFAGRAVLCIQRG